MHRDEKGHWNSIEIEANGKRLLIIVRYRLLKGSGQEIYTIKS